MGGWYGGGTGWISLVLVGTFWVGLLVSILWLVVRLLPDRGDRLPTVVAQSPEDILDARFARGEIDEQAYAQAYAALALARARR